MGGGGGTNTQTIQQADPWVGQQPYLGDIFQQAQQQYQTGQPQYYPGQTVAQPTQATTQAQQMQADYARGQAQQTAGAGGAYSQYVLGGGLLSPSSNPWLQQAAAGAVQPAYQQLQQNVLPGIRNQFQGGGQMGGSRDALAQGTAIGLTNQGAMNTVAQMYNTAYGQGLTATNQALLALPQTIAAGAQPAQLLSAVGQQQQQQQQQNINADVARWNYNQMLPQMALQTYAQMIQGNFGGSSMGTSLSNAGFSAAQGLGMAASLAALSSYAYGAYAGTATAAPATAGAVTALETAAEMAGSAA